ncbi:S26 family signal peptidase [Actinotalea ferrariae]|uniref:S26 family signal peptidase n=1 Tax=Actinotalea ferrariae TaxID=1386098 RepID=UPI001C8BFAA1|nr:S26 family signal peptidase [Actinotalea ferrariae]MBX9245787.1 S26 family signal peptidase [Actinotalea ferrariae]
MSDTAGVQAAGAGSPRRLLGRAGDVVLAVLAITLGWLLWPSSLGGCTTLTIVSGESMEPTYYTGDLVVSRCGPVEVGDVMVYQPKDFGGARIIHRVIGGDADGWELQGDNNDWVDPFEPTGDEVLGTAVLHLPHVGKVASIFLSPLTWISVLVGALAFLVWPAKDGEAPSEDGDGVESAEGDELSPEEADGAASDGDGATAEEHTAALATTAT